MKRILMKKIMWSLILCLTSTLVSAQPAEDMGNFIQTRLDGFTIDRVGITDYNCYIARLVSDEKITIRKTKKLINECIINADKGMKVIESWEKNHYYDFTRETIMLRVDSDENNGVFSIGMAVSKIDKYHIEITMNITRVSRAKLDLSNKQ